MASAKRMYTLLDVAKIKVDKKSSLAKTSPSSCHSIPVILLNGKPIDDPVVLHSGTLQQNVPTASETDDFLSKEAREQRITEIINMVFAKEMEKSLQQSTWAPPLNAYEDRRAKIHLDQPSPFLKDLAVLLNCQKVQNFIDEKEKQYLEEINNKKVLPNCGEFKLNFTNQYREQKSKKANQDSLSQTFLFNFEFDSLVTSQLKSIAFLTSETFSHKGRQ